MEIISIAIVIILAITTGTLTGLIPGLHINLIATAIIIQIPILLQHTTPEIITIFIITMGITHTFIDFIPATILGVPSSDTALVTMPAHKLVLKGKAYKAIQLSAIGSLSGIIYTILITPIMFIVLETIYQPIKTIIPYILIIAITIPIIKEPTKNQKFYAIITILLSASLGIFTLNTHLTNQPLLLLFSGIFGTATLIHSLNTNQTTLPKQTYNTKVKISKPLIKSITAGSITATLCSITPGIGNAQAASIASTVFKRQSSQLFITTISAINTINFSISLITLYIINKARNGAIIVLKNLPESRLTPQNLKLYLTIMIITAIIAYSLTLFLGKNIIKLTTKINTKKLNLSILIGLTTLIFYLTDFYSILILIAATAIGLFAINTKIKKIHLMSVLIIPILLNLI